MANVENRYHMGYYPEFALDAVRHAAGQKCEVVILGTPEDTGTAGLYQLGITAPTAEKLAKFDKLFWNINGKPIPGRTSGNSEPITWPYRPLKKRQ